MSYDPNLILPGSTLNQIIKDNPPPNLTNDYIKDYQEAERAIRTTAQNRTIDGGVSTISAVGAYYTPPAGPIGIGTKVIMGGIAGGFIKIANEADTQLKDAVGKLNTALSNAYNNEVPPLRPDLGNRIVYGDFLTDTYNKHKFENMMSDIRKNEIGGEISIPRDIQGMAERIRHYSEHGELEIFKKIGMPVDARIHTMLEGPYAEVTNKVVNGVGAGGQVPVLISQYENSGVTQAFRNSGFDIDNAFAFSQNLQSTYDKQQQDINNANRITEEAIKKNLGIDPKLNTSYHSQPKIDSQIISNTPVSDPVAEWKAKYDNMIADITNSRGDAKRMAEKINYYNETGDLKRFRDSGFDVNRKLKNILDDRYNNVTEDIKNQGMISKGKAEESINFYKGRGEIDAFMIAGFDVDNDLKYIRNNAKEDTPTIKKILDLFASNTLSSGQVANQQENTRKYSV